MYKSYRQIAIAKAILDSSSYHVLKYLHAMDPMYIDEFEKYCTSITHELV